MKKRSTLILSFDKDKINTKGVDIDKEINIEKLQQSNFNQTTQILNLF